MSIAIIAPGRNRDPWIKYIQDLDPSIEVVVYPDIEKKEDVIAAVVWSYPYGALLEYPNLKWVSSIGAGVDYILNDPKLPSDLIITRIVDRNLNRDMKRTAILAVLNWENKLFEYLTHDNWKKLDRTVVSTVGVAGMGQMGQAIAEALIALGYKVKGFSRNRKQIDKVEMYSGSKISTEFLQDLDVLISVLPLTSSTRNIYDRSTFEKMKRGAYFVNLGRGAHVNDDDLIASVSEGHLAGAWLDVFRREPLPEDHPFWTIPEITILPHVASVTDPATASEVVVENYHRLLEGGTLLHLVDRERGY